MTNTETATLVLKDETGSYYLVSQEMLEQVRVPAERTAEIEELIAEQQDTQGHFIPWGPIATGYFWYRIVTR